MEESNRLSIRAVRTEEELIGLKDCWNALLLKGNSPHIHSTFEWLYSWWKHMGDGAELFVLVAEQKGVPTAIAPLIIRRVGRFYKNLMKFRQLCFMGVGFTDRADFIITQNRKETIKAFLYYAKAHDDLWDEMSLKQINDQSPNFKYLEDLAHARSPKGKRYKKTIGPSIEDLYLELNGSFEEYFGSLSKKFSSRIMTYIRQLERLGQLDFSVVESPDANIIDEIRSLNRKRNALTGRRSMFLDESKLRFLLSVLPVLSKNSWLKLFQLRLDGRLVAYYLAFVFDNVLYVWNTSFDLAYSKHSVGRVLIYKMIEYSYARGYGRLDFMAGDEEYKFNWTQAKSNNYYFSIRKKDVKTGISLLYENIKGQMKDRALKNASLIASLILSGGEMP